MAKNLIIYYSRRGENYVNGGFKNLAKGNAEVIAEFTQKAVGGDLFQVETVTEYPASYMQTIDVAKTELQERKHPELKKYIDDVSEYDNIFVLGPCWWGTYPMAMFSLLERIDFAGKKVIPMMTHEGSGMGSSEQDLRKICKNAGFGTGLAVHGGSAAKSEKQVSDWAKKNV